MNFTILDGGVRLGRDKGDKALSHESTVTHHIRRMLNADGLGRWVRFYPDRVGLTACRQGVRNKKTGEMYWHANYQIEEAHKEFNEGAVYYHKA